MQRSLVCAATAALFCVALGGCSQGVYVAPAGTHATATSTPTAAPTGTPSATPTPVAMNATSLYVLNESSTTGQNEIEVFPAGASGNVAPSYVLGSSPGENGLAALSLAVDAGGDLYVYNETQTAGYTPNVTVFTPPITASSTAARTITSSSFPTDGSTCYLAVDPSADLYALCELNASNLAIFVFAPGSARNATPIRTISGSNTGLTIDTGLYSIAVDDATIYLNRVASNGAGSVLEFPSSGSGNIAPNVLGGTATGIDTPEALAVDGMNRLHVYNAGPGASTSILRFAHAATGNTPPQASIGTSAFSSSTSMALCDDAAGDAFLGTSANTPAIGFFPVSDSGSSTPARTISGSNTGLDTPIECAAH